MIHTPPPVKTNKPVKDEDDVDPASSAPADLVKDPCGESAETIPKDTDRQKTMAAKQVKLDETHKATTEAVEEAPEDQKNESETEATATKGPEEEKEDG